MWLTRVFIQRPTLVLVLIALFFLAGIISLQNLVAQQYPNVEKPVISIRVSYSGASTTEMRDSIVVPIENQIAGTPDLQTIDSTVQNGSASISSTFDLTSDPYTDLVYIQKALTQASKYLPTNLVPPTINISNPSETVVVTLGVTSKSLSPSALSLIITGVLIPDLEQIPDVANVNANGTVTPAYEVTVNPQILAGDNLTITDIVDTIEANNLHLPGGTLYAPNRSTSLDVRADITSSQSIADLLIQATPGTSGATSTVSQPLSPTATNPWTTLAAAHRISDVATVITGQEPQTSFAAVNGKTSFFLQVQKSANASEVTASNNVLAALPSYEQRFPQLAFTVINVQSKYTQQQLNAVVRTLAEGVVFIAVVMLFFLRSWRNAVVVVIAIPTSLAVTLFVMKMFGFTIDTVSLLGMTLAIGILIDDSTVVLENIERHRDELGQTPIRAAVSGRTEIGQAAMVLTLVDVVVFLPIAFLTDEVGRQLAEFGIVVTVATLTSLLISFTVTPALAGLWALNSTWKPPKFIDAFDNFFTRLRGWYHERALTWALANPVDRRRIRRRNIRTCNTCRKLRFRRQRVHPGARHGPDVRAVHVPGRNAGREDDARSSEGRAGDSQDSGSRRDDARCRRGIGELRRFCRADERRADSGLSQRQPQASDRVLGFGDSAPSDAARTGWKSRRDSLDRDARRQRAADR